MNLVSMAPSLYVLVVQHEKKLPIIKTLGTTHKESLIIAITFTGLLNSKLLSSSLFSTLLSLDDKMLVRAPRQ